MRPFPTFAAVIALLGPAACAPDGERQSLTRNDIRQIERLVPGADLSNLTPAQEIALATELHSADEQPLGGRLRAILY